MTDDNSHIEALINAVEQFAEFFFVFFESLSKFDIKLEDIQAVRKCCHILEELIHSEFYHEFSRWWRKNDE